MREWVIGHIEYAQKIIVVATGCVIALTIYHYATKDGRYRSRANPDWRLVSHDAYEMSAIWKERACSNYELVWQDNYTPAWAKECER